MGRRRAIYVEPFLQDRIEEARRYAEKVHNGLIDTEAELAMVFRMVISDHYKIPIFHSYFDERTFDELAFEAHLINLAKTPAIEQASSLISKNLAEAAAIAEQAWEDIDGLVPDEEELNRMINFMNTGKFEGEE